MDSVRHWVAMALCPIANALQDCVELLDGWIISLESKRVKR